MAVALTANERRWLVRLVVAVIAVRLVTLAAYPLMDSTEPRYAEIARKMLETGQWLVPQFDYGVPFWGKPPLAMWTAAASMAVFGVNEFAARLPSFVAMALCGAIVYALALLRGGRDQALWTLALFAGTGFVFIAAGSVMTDPLLTLGTTMSMAGYWIAVHGPVAYRRRAALAFFAGLVVGLLAKGPLALVLTGVPVAGTIAWTRSWRLAWQRLPWIGGMAAALGVAGVWYASAERASPGFLAYFLVGEHWNRYLKHGWTGDLYGAAHSNPRGFIWLWWIAAALPWSIGTLGYLGRAALLRRDQVRAFAADPWLVYLALWAATPLLLFTPAANILIVYVLPGLPAYALIVGDRWRPGATEHTEASPAAVRPAVRRALMAAAAIPLVFSIGVVALHEPFEVERSHKALVGDFMRLRPDAASALVYYPDDRPPSAEFYSRGTAHKARDLAALTPYLDAVPPSFVAMREKDLLALPEPIRARLAVQGAYGSYRLLRITPR